MSNALGSQGSLSVSQGSLALFSAQGQNNFPSLASATGQNDSLALVSAKGQPDLRGSQMSVGSAASDGNVASSAQLHKQLLAAEVAKVFLSCPAFTAVRLIPYVLHLL